MAEGLNQVTLIGNLGADPEVKGGAGGTVVVKLRVATAESYKDKNGEWKERTEWHPVVGFGRGAEAAAKLLTKGARVAIEGRLTHRTYEKDGQKRYSTEVVANRIILCERKDPARGAGGRAPVQSPDNDDGDAFSDLSFPGD